MDKKNDKKGKAPPPGKKDAKKEEAHEQKEAETFIPVSSDHYMEEIRSYLQKLEGQTVKEELAAATCLAYLLLRNAEEACLRLFNHFASFCGD